MTMFMLPKWPPDMPWVNSRTDLPRYFPIDRGVTSAGGRVAGSRCVRYAEAGPTIAPPTTGMRGES
jgi:hypothetical protein